MKNRKLVLPVFLREIFSKRGISPWLMVLGCAVLMLPVLFVACVDNTKPGIIYDSSLNISTTDKPVITGITPSTKAIAGIREIKILGKNLGIKNGTDTSWVVIGGANAMIKDVQDSVVTIYRPRLSNDHYDKNISVSVTDTKILAASSSMEYYVESPGAVTGDYSNIAATLLAVEFDNQENLYTTALKNLYKTDFAGVTQTIVLNPTNLLSSDYAGITAMSFGPGAHGRNLFIAVGKSYIARLYVVDTLDKKNSPVKLTVPGAVSQLDFDENGNLYTAGNGSLYVADTSVGSGSAPTFTPISGYEGVNIIKIRVVKESGSEYLYAADSTHVWKSQLGGSSLIKGTPLVDLSTNSVLSGCTISSFEIDENGSVFLCLKKHPKHSLFIRENDGSITPFYGDASILPNTVEKLMWGNTKYLYLISGSLGTSPTTYAAGRIYRMALDRNGAPYQGRKFIK